MEATLAFATVILTAGTREIDNFLNGRPCKGVSKNGKVGITQLSKDIASEVNCSFTFSYSLLHDMVSRRTDIKSEAGPHGGFKKVVQ